MNVTIRNNEILTVEVTNSPVNDSSTVERQEISDHLALLIIDIYTDSPQLDLVRIVFVTSETRYLVVTFREVIDTFEYPKRALLRLQPNNALHLQRWLPSRSLQQQPSRHKLSGKLA